MMKLIGPVIWPRRFLIVPTLHISLLGAFLLISGETPVTGIDMPRLQSLLAYLLLHNSVPQSRSHLAYLLWPDSTEGQAHINLRNVVHKLRQALPDADTFLHVDRQTISWKPGTKDAPWTLDVLAFKMAIARADQARDASVACQALVEAVKLYRGDLLPGCYDEWILPERDRLREMFLKALERLIELQEQQRDYEAAISTAQHLLRHDPLHEATYRHLMRLYATGGDRAAALRIYHTCSTVLERELVAQPSSSTREIYERLLRTEGLSEEQKTSHPTLMSEVPLVGRQQEWAQLQSAWSKVAAGRPHFFLLFGEAGVGKTRLAEELLTWVGRQGIATAIAHCYAAEGELAYAPVAAWLRSDSLRMNLSSLASVWLTEVARLLPNLLVEQPELPRPGPLLESWQRQQFFEALARATLQRKIAKTWEIQYRYEEALHAYSAAETALGQEPPTSAEEWWQEWIELQDKKLDLYGMLSQMGKVAELLEKMRPIVEQYGTLMQRAEFFISSALTASRLNRFRVSEEILDEARAGLAAYEALGNPVKIGWSHLSLGNLYQFRDYLSDAKGRCAKH